MLTVLIFLGVVLLFYRKVYQPLWYWKYRNIPHDTPLPLLGNLLDSMLKKRSISQIITQLYDKYSNYRYFGFHSFGTPTLMIRDVELAKQVCIKDFEYFADHRVLVPKGIDKMWDKLIFIREGADWQEHRKVSSAAFTLSKMKLMFPNLSKTAQRLMATIEKNSNMVSGNLHPFVMKIANDFTLDFFMGIECDTYKDPNNEFFGMARRTYVKSKLKGFMFFCAAFNCSLGKLFKIKFFPTDGKLFYRNLVKEVLQYRRMHNITRIDMLHLLNEGLLEHLRLNKRDPENDELEDEIVSQLMGMYFANFDSFTTSLCNCMYELALQSEVQEKLINEIDETWTNCKGDLPYDTLMQMKYLDMVYKELMRLRSNTTFINRIVTKPYTIEPELSHEKPVTLLPGQDITIPLYSFMRDGKFFPDPLKFDPERYNDENKANVDPRAYLPFGCGPRKCIASRLISVEIRLMLFHFLLRFRFVPTERTVVPFVESKRHNVMSSEYGYYIHLEPRKDADNTYFRY